MAVSTEELLDINEDGLEERINEFKAYGIKVTVYRHFNFGKLTRKIFITHYSLLQM